MLTVIIALGANALIAVLRSIAAVFTGSASMVAEAAHSWVDTGNEIFRMMEAQPNVTKALVTLSEPGTNPILPV